MVLVRHPHFLPIGSHGRSRNCRQTSVLSSLAAELRGSVLSVASVLGAPRASREPRGTGFPGLCSPETPKRLVVVGDVPFPHKAQGPVPTAASPAAKGTALVLKETLSLWRGRGLVS